MNVFIFGINGEKETSIKANDIETAIKVYKVDNLFPEEHVDKKYHALNENGYSDRDYVSVLGRYIYKFIDNPMITIHEYKDNDDRHYYTKSGRYKTRKPLTETFIPLSECVIVDFQQLNPVPLIGFESNDEEEDVEDKQELIKVTTELLEGTNIPLKDVSAYSKTEMRQIHDMVKRKRAELEYQSDKLRGIISAFEKEISIKKKMIYMISTYLGIKEEVRQLKEGKKADDKEPLSIFQMKLFMDEEIGLWDGEDKGGIDLKDIKKFDKWISSKDRFKKFLYKEKSVCAFQVRRKEKKYSEDAWENAMLNQGNNNTYFLIRNGENLYRIWSDIHIVDRMFPTLTEYENILKEESRYSEEKVQRKHESYMYGLIAIQGLIERTDIFGYELRTKVNLMKINGFTEENVNLIRDDESNMWLTDGMLSWNDYTERNQKSIKVGTRIIFMKIEYPKYDSRYSDGGWRTQPFKPSDYPNKNEIYIVEDDAEYKENSYYNYGDGLKITYLPVDTVDTVGWEYDPHDRKNKVPYRLYKQEVLNYDDITVEECEHFENNRFERPNYLNILPVLHWIKTVKREEEKLENEFIKFIKPQLPGEVTDEEIKHTILWWKLKNKWKRGLMTDDAKAVRMIIKKIKSKIPA